MKRSPCLSYRDTGSPCPHATEDKNLPTCVNCPDRIEYAGVKPDPPIQDECWWPGCTRRGYGFSGLCKRHRMEFEGGRVVLKLDEFDKDSRKQFFKAVAEVARAMQVDMGEAIIRCADQGAIDYKRSRQ